MSVREDLQRDGFDFWRDGFTVVRGLVPPAEVAEMGAAFDRLLARARQLPIASGPGSKGVEDVDGSRFVVDAEPFRLRRVVWCGGAEPVLGRYGADPRFVRIAAEVLGTPTVVQLVQQAHFKLPHDGVDFAWHQDASNRRYGTDLFTDVDGHGSFVQIAFAIDAQGRNNGGLELIPGTHRLGFVADVETGVLPAGSFDPALAVAPAMEPGDAVVFGPFTVHGSAKNDSDVPRRLFIQGYAAPGANRRVYPGCGTGVERRVAG